MVSRFLLLASAVLLFTLNSIIYADERDEARAQVEFGISVARAGLWQEAIYRWERASKIDPDYASAWNNLGIAYEREGSFNKALEAYETALDLDPNNVTIETNYDLFLEVSDRVSEDPQ